jgi:hypothetical protein
MTAERPSRARPLVATRTGEDGLRFEYLEVYLAARLPLEGQSRPWRVVSSEPVPLEEAYRNEAAALNDLGALGWRVIDVEREVDRAQQTIARHYLLERTFRE